MFSEKWIKLQRVLCVHSTGNVRLDTALELSLYLSRETEIMAVTQGFQELVPLYKLMEKRDMAALENRMKVRKKAAVTYPKMPIKTLPRSTVFLAHLCTGLQFSSSLPVNLVRFLPACVPQDYIVDLFRWLIDRQEWTDSGSVSERVLRSYLLLFGSVRNYAPCVTKATQLFNRWRDSEGTMRSVLMN